MADCVMSKLKHRVSLADMSAQAKGVLRRATYDKFDTNASPTLDDLTESLFIFAWRRSDLT